MTPQKYYKIFFIYWKSFENKTKQSIAISLVSKLSHFDSPNMMQLTTSNDIEFEQLGEKKTAIYVISPDSHTTYNYILTIFYLNTFFF